MLKLNRVAPSAVDRGLRPGVDVARNLPSTSVSAWLNYVSFNPLTAITWKCAAWAADPLWSNPGDGADVVTWRDGSGNGYNFGNTTAANRPSFVAADAGLNYRAAVNFSGASDALGTASFGADVSEPFTMLAIGRQTVAASNTWTMTGHNSTGTAWQTCAAIGMRASGTNRWCIERSNPQLSTAVADTNNHLFRATATNSTNYKLYLDETLTINAAAAGTYCPAALCLGAYHQDIDPSLALSNGWGKPVLAFAGLYLGDITANALWPAFKAWARTYYGLTIA